MIIRVILILFLVNLNKAFKNSIEIDETDWKKGISFD